MTGHRSPGRETVKPASLVHPHAANALEVEQSLDQRVPLRVRKREREVDPQALVGSLQVEIVQRDSHAVREPTDVVDETGPLAFPWEAPLGQRMRPQGLRPLPQAGGRARRGKRRGARD